MLILEGFSGLLEAIPELIQKRLDARRCLQDCLAQRRGTIGFRGMSGLWHPLGVWPQPAVEDGAELTTAEEMKLSDDINTSRRSTKDKVCRTDFRRHTGAFWVSPSCWMLWFWSSDQTCSTAVSERTFRKAETPDPGLTWTQTCSVTWHLHRWASGPQTDRTPIQVRPATRHDLWSECYSNGGDVFSVKLESISVFREDGRRTSCWIRAHTHTKFQ